MKHARLILAGLWLLLTVLGALNHTLIPGLLDATRLSEVFPNLRYGYVMFNKNPEEVAVVTYQDRGTWHGIADLIATPAPFYKTTRSAINVWIDGNYLVYLCRRQDHDIDFRVSFYHSSVAEPVDTRELPCRNGELHGF